jgi:AcrR family transcriptional regulator
METLNPNRLPHNLTTLSQLKQSRRAERSDAAQNRRKILQVAQRLFAERGVDNVTMSEIAEEACIGKGTLYRHYAHKGQLCLALLEENATDYQNEILSGFGQQGRETTALGRLYLFIDRSLDFVEQHHALLNAVFISLTTQQNDTVYQHPGYDANRLIMLVLLKEAIASGECRADLDVEYAADALLAPLQTGLYVHQRQVLGFSLTRIKAGIRQLFQGILA